MNNDWSAFDDVLGNLSRAEPESRHSALVRDKCHKALRRLPLRQTVESVIVGTFCAAYVTIGAIVIAFVYAPR
jgi:hypothetical protein